MNECNKNSIFVSPNVKNDVVEELFRENSINNVEVSTKKVNVIAVGNLYQENNIAISYDHGNTFSTTRLKYFNNIKTSAFNGKYWIVGGEANNTFNIARSSDGVNWQYTYCDLTKVNTVAWIGNKWIVGGNGNVTKLLYSTNGLDWNYLSSQLTTEVINICWNGVACLVNAIGQSTIFYNFPLINIVNGLTISAITWGNSYFLACFDDDKIYRSSDGKIWGLATNNISDITFLFSNGFQQIAGTNNNIVYTDLNIKTTSSVPLKVTKTITYTKRNCWLIAGDNTDESTNVIYISADLNSWKKSEDVKLNIVNSISSDNILPIVNTMAINSSGYSSVVSIDDNTEYYLKPGDEIILINTPIDIYVENTIVYTGSKFTIVNRTDSAISFNNFFITAGATSISSLNAHTFISFVANIYDGFLKC